MYLQKLTIGDKNTSKQIRHSVTLILKFVKVQTSPSACE